MEIQDCDKQFLIFLLTLGAKFVYTTKLGFSDIFSVNKRYTLYTSACYIPENIILVHIPRSEMDHFNIDNEEEWN